MDHPVIENMKTPKSVHDHVIVKNNPKLVLENFELMKKDQSQETETKSHSQSQEMESKSSENEFQSSENVHQLSETADKSLELEVQSPKMHTQSPEREVQSQKMELKIKTSTPPKVIHDYIVKNQPKLVLEKLEVQSPELEKNIKRFTTSTNFVYKKIRDGNVRNINPFLKESTDTYQFDKLSQPELDLIGNDPFEVSKLYEKYKNLDIFGPLYENSNETLKISLDNCDSLFDIIYNNMSNSQINSFVTNNNTSKYQYPTMTECSVTIPNLNISTNNLEVGKQTDFSSIWIGPLRKFKCLECDFSTNYQEFLKNHDQICISKDLKFSCILCGFRSQASRIVRKHFEIDHAIRLL